MGGNCYFWSVDWERNKRNKGQGQNKDTGNYKLKKTFYKLIVLYSDLNTLLYWEGTHLKWEWICKPNDDLYIKLEFSSDLTLAFKMWLDEKRMEKKWKRRGKPITWAVQSPKIEGLGLEFSFVLV